MKTPCMSEIDLERRALSQMNRVQQVELLQGEPVIRLWWLLAFHMEQNIYYSCFHFPICMLK